MQSYKIAQIEKVFLVCHRPWHEARTDPHATYIHPNANFLFQFTSWTKTMHNMKQLKPRSWFLQLFQGKPSCMKWKLRAKLCRPN